MTQEMKTEDPPMPVLLDPRESAPESTDWPLKVIQIYIGDNNIKTDIISFDWVQTRDE